jgi:hypothetical protein
MTTGARKGRTTWMYVGGLPINYPDEVDTTRLWSLSLEERQSEMERFAQRTLDEPGAAPRMKKDAQRVLRAVDQLRTALRSRNCEDVAHAALDLGLAVDALALLWEFGPDLVAGQRQRIGGIEGAQRTSRGEDEHAKWLAADSELQTKRPELKERERARIVARQFGENDETVRRRVREMRKKVGKPSPFPQKGR